MGIIEGLGKIGAGLEHAREACPIGSQAPLERVSGARVGRVRMDHRVPQDEVSAGAARCDRMHPRLWRFSCCKCGSDSVEMLRSELNNEIVELACLGQVRRAGPGIERIDESNPVNHPHHEACVCWQALEDAQSIRWTFVVRT
jgi:hypothetical protein